MTNRIIRIVAPAIFSLLSFSGILVLPFMVYAQDMSPGLVKKAAIFKAREIFGEVQVYSIDQVYGFDEKLKYHIITLYPSNTNPINKRELALALRSQQEQLNSLRKKQKGVNATKKIKDIQSKMYMFEKFYTVYVNTSSDKTPVAKMRKGLPVHTVLYQRALEAAITYTNSPVSPGKIYSLGPFKILMRFNTAGDSVIVDLRDFKVEYYSTYVNNLSLQPEARSTKPDAAKALSPEQQQRKKKHNDLKKKRIKKKWDEIIEGP